MRPWHCLAALATLALTTDVVALNPPSDSTGPVTLLSCVVGPMGILEAEVDSKTDDTMACNIHCGYELGGKPFSQWLEVIVPAHFNGRLGRFDTNGGREGNFHGEMGTCKKTEKHPAL